MPSWNEVQNEIKSAGSAYDIYRRRYLKELSDQTGRNTIIYYSGWIEKAMLLQQGLTGVEVNDGDKNGFMATIHGMDRTLGLDLLLHTPGGDVAATESLVDYLLTMFDGDIRVIVPQLALSAGTMIALASREIVMGKHSSLGPIDPQIAGLAAHGVVEEFERAAKEIRDDPSCIPLWQPIIAKYPPAFIGECEKAIEWSKTVTRSWLLNGMLSGRSDATATADKILGELASHALTLSHNRHISMAKARELGLNVVALEDDDQLQTAVLTVHHSCIHTLSDTAAFKIIENQNGVSFISAVQVQARQ